jgi:hypothetical protein
MSPEIDQLTLPAEDWRSMLAAASELDLVHGGYFRARPAEIQFFAGPDNAPEGWNEKFTDGSPDVPRALVGRAEAAFGEDLDHPVIRLVVSNWSAMRAVKQAYDRGEYRGRFQDYVLAQEGALRGRAEDRAWLCEQFHRLLAHANGKLVGG